MTFNEIQPARNRLRPTRNRIPLFCVGFISVLVSCAEEPPPTPVPQAPEEVRRVTPEEVTGILRAVIGDDLEAARGAVGSIVANGDQRFASVLIELMRASQLEILHADGRSAYGRALEAITGEFFGDDYHAWVEWYDASDLEPPADFARWKSELLGRLDPAFAEILGADRTSKIRIEEVVWGGVAFDGIPALDEPATVTAGDATYLADDDPVFGVAIGGHARAYPLRIMDWHEMANDTIGDVPISLAYCTLCGSGVAYYRRASDGKVYDFGSSGLLMRSNKLMFDRQTRSLWNQFTGRPVVGPLADADLKLARVPLVVTKWGDWKAMHPETRVLDDETGHDREYTPGAAYADYFATPELMFPVRQRSGGLAPKAWVYGVQIRDVAKAYSLDRLHDSGVTNDRVAMTSIALVANRGPIVVAGRSLRTGPATYRAGGEVRAYDRGEREFRPGPDAQSVLDDNGATWRVTEEALVGPGDERAPRVDGMLSYWFAWNAFHPETQIYESR